jgi:hypothetical protein
MFLAIQNFGAGAGGWSSQDRFPRKLADVNDDGRADIVGFGQDRFYVALASPFVPTGFLPVEAEDRDFAVGIGASSNQAWPSQDRYPRALGDVTGDGDADIVGFGDGGVFVARSVGLRESAGFLSARLVFPNFGAGPIVGEWASQDRFPRKLADVNGDNRDDIVGFPDAGVVVALATGTGGFI